MTYQVSRKQLSTAERIAALSRVSAALMSEWDEARLLHLIAETACNLTGAAFAAFTLRPVNEEGQPLVPSEGHLFYLAAIVGVSKEYEALLRRMALGGEGLLAPIFRHGVSVLVPDAQALMPRPEDPRSTDAQGTARQAASAYAQGQLSAEALRSLGVPRGHPIVRSFLGAPLLDRAGQVRGGLLLGHSEPGQFTPDDEAVLVGLAAQAAVKLENVRLYRMAERRAQQLDRIFESIGDGVTLLDQQGNILRENGAARRLREHLQAMPDGQQVVEALLHAPARRALDGETVQDSTVRVGAENDEMREYLVTASALHEVLTSSGPLKLGEEATRPSESDVPGAVVVWHNVTERRIREAEREAKAQLGQLEATFEAITDAVFVYDSKGHILQMNTAGRKLVGFDVVPEYAARSLEERYARYNARDEEGHPLSHEQWPTLRVLKGEVLTGANTIHAMVHTLDEREVELSVGGAPLYHQDGRIMGAVLILRDVTERLRLERRLRDSEREAKERATQLEAIFDAMTDALFVYDADGHVVQTNAAARVFLAQHTPADSTLRTLAERASQVAVFTVDGQQLAPERLPVSRMLAGEVLTPEQAVDIVFPSLQGQLMYVSMTGGPIENADGNSIGALAIMRDITERFRLEHMERQMYAQIQARLALLQMILDELPSSVYLVRGHDARLVLANRATATLWGATWPHDQPMSEFLAQNTIRIFGSDGRPLSPEQFATLRAVQHGETAQQYQEVIRHADGTTLPVLVNAVALDAHHLDISLPQEEASPASGAEYLAIVVHQDVTALKEAEKLKDEFIGIAAHELRNPLAVLKGYAQMLLFQTKQGRGVALADWQTEALQNIDRATMRLADLTDDLLDVTRLQAGGLELRPEPTDLLALTQRVVHRLQMTTQHHTFSITASGEYLVVPVDPRRMEQVLGNLIGNAIKYSPGGGPIELTLSEEMERQTAVLSIRDAGIGIPMQEQARIFGRFARAANTNAYGISGTGLGLYLCRELIERQGGRIWFESTEGQGSTFFIALPITPTENGMEY